MQRAIFHSKQETYEGSSYMSMVTDKEIHIASSIYKNRINNFLSRKVMNLLERTMVPSRR